MTSLRKKLTRFALGTVILVWAILYLPHLRTLPSWYGDETLTLMIGKSLFEGKLADRAFKPTFWHPSYAYQPGYAWAVGAASTLWKGDILGGRFLNVLLALAIALMLYLGSRRFIGEVTALSSALLFLSYSQSIIHFRWIYPHNAVALGFLLTTLSLLRKSSPKSNRHAGWGLAIAAFSHPLFAHGAIAAWLCRIKRPSAWLRMAIPPALVLFLSISLIAVAYFPHLWIFQDMGMLGSFYEGFSNQNGGNFLQVLRNIYIFYSYDFLHVFVAIGIVLCCNRRFYPIAIFALTVSGFLLQNRQNLPLFYYQAIVFLPILVLAGGGGIREIERWLRKKGFRFYRLAGFALFIASFICFSENAKSVWTKQLVPRNFPWTTHDTEEVEQIAQWVNQHTSPDDLVVAHQNIGWLLHAHTTDLMQAAAWAGFPTFTFENLPAHDRFSYPADMKTARYVILADIDRVWTRYQPFIDDLLEILQNQEWPVVLAGQTYIVLKNPNVSDHAGKNHPLPHLSE